MFAKLHTMAKGDGNFGFTGSLGNITAYKTSTSDKVILRTKGGASKNKIKRSPKFAKFRLCQKEFGACSNLGKTIRNTIYAVKHLADPHMSGHLNGFLKSILNLDTENKLGQRSVLVSRYRHLLEGYNLNRLNPFNTVIRHPVTCTLSRDTGMVRLSIPELLPGINFYNASKYPLYRFIVVMGVIPDMVFETKYYPEIVTRKNFPEHFYTEWNEAAKPAAMQNIELQIKHFKPLADNETLITAIGVEFGFAVSNTVTNPVKYGGSACIVATG